MTDPELSSENISNNVKNNSKIKLKHDDNYMFIITLMYKFLKPKSLNLKIFTIFNEYLRENREEDSEEPKHYSSPCQN